MLCPLLVQVSGGQHVSGHAPTKSTIKITAGCRVGDNVKASRYTSRSKCKAGAC